MNESQAYWAGWHAAMRGHSVDGRGNLRPNAEGRAGYDYPADLPAYLRVDFRAGYNEYLCANGG